jgi:hypothetical protein
MRYDFNLTSDSSGDATETKNINGLIDTVVVNYADDVEATCDITITGYVGSKSFTIYSKTDSKTDAVIRPRTPMMDNAGSAVTYDGTNEIYDKFFVESVTVTIAQAGSGKVVKCFVVVD